MSNGRIYNLSHCTYVCKYHLVWSCKYRRAVLTDTYIKAEMKRIIKQISKWKGFVPHQWHIGDDHVHLHVTIPPKYSVSYAMSILKGKTSSWIKKKSKKMPKGSIWTRGYYASTVGINEQQIRHYIENQRHNQLDQPKLFE